MNQQPNQLTANIFTICFIGLILYFLFKNKNKEKNYDLFEIIYEVDRSNIAQPISYNNNNNVRKVNKQVNIPKNAIVSKPKPKPAPKTQPSPEPKKVKIESLKKKDFNELHDNCVLALVSLGMKKSEANKTVIDIFNKYEDITTIEDFIKKAFVPNEYYKPST